MQPDHPLLLRFLALVLWSFLLGSGYVWWRNILKLRAKEPVLPFHERPHVTLKPWSVVAALFVWIACPVLAVAICGPGRELPLSSVKRSCLSNLLIVLIVPAVLVHRGQFRWDAFGIRLSGWKQQLADGTVGFLASLLPVYLVLLATQSIRKPDTQHPFLQILQDNPSLVTVAWIAAAAVILAPLAEELIFRVVLQGSLQSLIPPRVAIVVVSLLFSAVHGWPDALPLVPLALVLGYVYYRRHSYVAVVALHILFNAANLLMALLLQQPESAESAVGW